MNPDTKFNAARDFDNRSPAWIDALTGIGADWAKFGLQIGTQALERSAKSLELAAKTLETLSKAFERQAEAHAKSDVASDEVITVDASEAPNEDASTDGASTDGASTDGAR